MKRSIWLAVALASWLYLLPGRPALAQATKHVVLQAFWWNFSNANYPQGWANYLADLAPRLRAAGITAVWIPPNVKNANPASVGYSPFDQYDLGDKYQKGNLKTPFGDKDEYLRMVAVLHSNGIRVIEDLVLNHMDGAGAAGGAGAIDPAGVAFYSAQSGLPNPDPTGGNKTFRYACFAQPAGNESATEYLSRTGRWPKNWENFFPNPSDARLTGDDLSREVFGPDIGYNDGSYGQASQAGYNPVQPSRYMRDQARAWAIWMKKQTAYDGVRLDAVKHFPTYVAEDILYNIQNNAGFATYGPDMPAVGEWVGSKTEIDAWTDNVQGRAGTFDFSLRGFSGTPGLYGMVYGQGNYDLSNLPGLQQQRRDRTFPFVNSHDTFRPTLVANGNFATNWGGSNELAPHVDPREPRLAAAYAVVFAMDGNPNVFIEDLFDLGTTGKRYTHLPTSTTDLPIRDDIATLAACHEALGFKQGAYQVPYQSADHLIIERAGKAIIGITDNFANWQAQWITTSFPAGTRLMDYGGSSGNTDVRTVAADGRVQISTPPCNGTARRRGYSVWAPLGLSIAQAPADIQTVQEWEMADDLGDSHVRSLGQGGQLPANSFALRRAGKIYPDSTRPFTVTMFAVDTTRRVTLLLMDGCGGVIDSVSGRRQLSLTHTPTRQGWIQLGCRQAAAGNPAQKVFIKASYYAPKFVNAVSSISYVPVTADLGEDRALCQFTGTLSANTGPGFSYVWRDSTNTEVSVANNFVPPYPGRFTVTKTNTTSGCSATASVRVTAIVPLPQQPNIRQQGDTLVIDAEPGVTYQWRSNSVDIAGATGSSYLPTASGSYSVLATNSTGCKLNSAFFSYTVSIHAAMQAGIHIWPNPTAGRVRITLDGAARQATALAILDAAGRTLQTQTLADQSTEVDLAALPSGLYNLKLSGPAGSACKMLVLQK